MSATEHAQPEPRVTLEVTRTVTVSSRDGKPSLELKIVGDDVYLVALPRNSARRLPVALGDLIEAVERLRGA